MAQGYFEKGNKLSPGRKKGVPNKLTMEIKTMITTALEEAGGVEYLKECALDPRSKAAFLGLVGKVLPMQITGKDGGAIETVSRLVIKGE